MKQTLQKLLSLRLLMAFALVMGAYGAAWADESKLSFTAACNGSGTADDNVTWTVTSDGDESSFDSTKGIHYGTGKAAVQYIKLSTSGITGTITKIVVNASTASGVSATVGVTVGGNTFGGNAKSLGSTAKDYTFEGSAEGEIEVTVTKPSSATKALYVKSVAVTYQNNDPSKLDAELSFPQASYTFNLGQTFSAPTLHTASGFDGTVEYASSDEDVARVDSETGELTLLDEGTTTITASFAGNETYRAGSASYTLTVTDNRIVTTISNDNIEISLTDVATLTKLAPVVKDADNNVVAYTYGSWPTEVSFEIVSDENAIIGSLDNNSGEITLNAVVGTATLKAYYNFYSVNSTNKPSECTFTIKVYDPNVTYYALVADLGNGNGKALSTSSASSNALKGVDVNIVNGKVINGKADNISWEITDNKGTKIVKTTNGDYLVHGTNERNTDLKLSESSNGNSWVTTSRGDFGAVLGRDQAIQWSVQNTVFKNYAGTDNGYYAASQYTFADGYVRSNLTSTWGTICLPSTVEAEDLAGAKFYSIAGKVVNSANEATSIVLEEETVGLIAGVPYIFELNEGSTKVVAAYQDDEDPATSNNGLVGSLEGQAVDEGMYLLSGGKVVKCGTGCSIAANRAYIDMSQVSVYSGPTAGVKMLGVGGNIADSITAIDGEIRSDVIYNLAGQRLQRPVRGINIIGGKKVLVK